jgi:predicted transcriptional regulator
MSDLDQFGIPIEEAVSVQKQIEQLLKLEDRARSISSRLSDVQYKWQNLYDKLVETPEWQQSCADRGYSVSYEFRDVLA